MRTEVLRNSILERTGTAMIMQQGRGGRGRWARGELLPPASLFERPVHASASEGGEYCWCLVHFARALARTEAGEHATARRELAAGFALVRSLDWIGFLRPHVDVVARLCALALDYGVETELVRRVILARNIAPPRPNIAGWPRD